MKARQHPRVVRTTGRVEIGSYCTCCAGKRKFGRDLGSIVARKPCCACCASGVLLEGRGTLSRPGRRVGKGKQIGSVEGEDGRDGGTEKGDGNDKSHGGCTT